MKVCPHCNGRGISSCVVCFGKKGNPQKPGKGCGFCKGYGETKCIICLGKKMLPEDDIFAVDGELPNYPGILRREDK